MDTVHKCNCLLNKPTANPLAGVLEITATELLQLSNIRAGFYTIIMTEHKCDNFDHGRKTCDFSCATAIFLKPGEKINTGSSGCKGCSLSHIVAFHPDLLCGTKLADEIEHYSFFRYSNKEALHVSACEKDILCECISAISRELNRPADIYSHTIVTRHISLLLDYCRRFYHRQFITRADINNRILQHTKKFITDFFTSERGHRTDTGHGLPTPQSCAAHLGLSEAYLEDLVRHEKGMSISEYIQARRFDIAEEMILNSGKTLSEISKRLAYPSPQCLSYIFTKKTGMTPCQSRMRN